MIRLLNTSLSILIVTIATACSTQQTINSFTPKPPMADKAAVYLYRPLSTTNAFYSPDLYIDEEFKYSIKSGKKTRLLLDAGETVFEIEPDKKYAGVTRLSKKLEAGGTYYLRIDTSLKIKNAVGYEPYERSFNLVEVSSQQAIEEISKCCHSPSDSNSSDDRLEHHDLKTDEADSSDSGFSVDKTQNPFSH